MSTSSHPLFTGGPAKCSAIAHFLWPRESNLSCSSTCSTYTVPCIHLNTTDLTEEMPVIFVSQKLQWTWKPSSQSWKRGRRFFYTLLAVERLSLDCACCMASQRPACKLPYMMWNQPFDAWVIQHSQVSCTVFHNFDQILVRTFSDPIVLTQPFVRARTLPASTCHPESEGDSNGPCFIWAPSPRTGLLALTCTSLPLSHPPTGYAATPPAECWINFGH